MVGLTEVWGVVSQVTDFFSGGGNAENDGNILTNNPILSGVAAGGGTYYLTGSFLDAAMVGYGTEEMLAGDLNILERGALAWGAGNVAQAAVEQMGGGWLSQTFAGWGTTIGVFMFADNVSDSIAESRERPVAAPALAPAP